MPAGQPSSGVSPLSLDPEPTLVCGLDSPLESLAGGVGPVPLPLLAAALVELDPSDEPATSSCVVTGPHAVSSAVQPIPPTTRDPTVDDTTPRSGVIRYGAYSNAMPDRRTKRVLHALDENGMVVCNPRDREAAHRAEVEGIATDDPGAVTCLKCRVALAKVRRDARTPKS